MVFVSACGRKRNHEGRKLFGYLMFPSNCVPSTNGGNPPLIEDILPEGPHLGAGTFVITQTLSSHLTSVLASMTGRLANNNKSSDSVACITFAQSRFYMSRRSDADTALPYLSLACLSKALSSPHASSGRAKSVSNGRPPSL